MKEREGRVGKQVSDEYHVFEKGEVGIGGRLVYRTRST